MRLIDADALHKDIIDTITTCRELIANKTQEAVRERMEGSTTAFLEVAMRIKDAPTIDTVPVVRCSDCKYKETLQKGTFGDILGYDGECNIVRMFVKDNCFCAWGERRTENDSDGK